MSRLSIRMLFFVLLMYTFSNVQAAISEEIITITNADGNTSSEVLADRNVIVYVEDTEEGWIEAAASYLGLDYDGYSASEYVTEENSKYYRTVDGVLYSKDMRVLYLYPAMKEGWYFQVPATVEIIEECAFQGSYYLRELVIPSSVIQMDGDDTFYGSAVETIHFPKSIVSFNVNMFDYVPQLEKIILPAESVVASELYAQREYIDLTSKLYFY